MWYRYIESLDISQKASRSRTLRFLKQGNIYIALFPPIVEDTHMTIQYSEQCVKGT